MSRWPPLRPAAICAIALCTWGAVGCISLGTIDGDDEGSGEGDGGRPYPRDDGGKTPRADTAEGPAAPDAAGRGDAPGGVDSSPLPSPDPDLPLARGVTISEIAFFQAVKIDLEKGGARVAKRNADVVAGREGLLRVYVTGATGELVGKLKLTSGAGAPTVITTHWTSSGTPSDGALASTLNFEVPSDVLTTSTTWMVSLHTSAAPGAGTTDGAMYPAAGTPEALGARDTGPALKITIVPVKDASGRLPDVGAAQLEEYRRSAYAMYPARKVEISVRAPYDWGGRIGASSNNFNELLDSIINLHISNKTPHNIYYYNTFTNTSSFDT
ncbi:MAG: hypothetical protein ABI175_06110, partial [Polyangiales bacterium]